MDGRKGKGKSMRLEISLPLTLPTIFVGLCVSVGINWCILCYH